MDAMERLRSLGVWAPLELGSTDRVSLAATRAAPQRVAAQGAGRLGAVVLTLAQLLSPEYYATAPLREAPHGRVAVVADEGAGRALEAAPLPVRIRQHERDAGVLLIDNPSGHVRPLAGAVEIRYDDDGVLVVLDSRISPAAVQYLCDEGEFVLVTDRGAIELYRVEREHSVSRVVTAVVPVAAVPSPDVEAWLRASTSPAWLLERACREARSPSTLDRVGAAGLLVRLWSPGDASARARFLAGELDGPADAVEHWVRERSPAELADVEQHALTEVQQIEDDLHGLSVVPSAERPAYEARLLLARDRLECVLSVLALGRGGDTLRDALAQVDALGEERIGDFSAHAAFEDDPQLAEAAAREPDRWWATVVTG